MTDKPASGKNSNKSQQNKNANTITKSTDKSAKTSTQSTSEKPSSATAPTNTKNVEPKKEVKSTPTKPAPSKPNTTDKTNSVNTKTSSAAKTTKPAKQESSSKISKLAIFALLIALIAVGGVVALYYWHMQQQEALEARLKEATNKSTIEIQEQMSKVLTMQQESLAMQVEDSVKDMENNTVDRIAQLNQMVEKFSQNQPTDWLVHEAEYLVRVASRTLWLEKDATAAVGLLLDANDRITELNNPEVLPVRQLIHQDIATIKALPTLETEEVIMSLIALGEQVQDLPLLTLSVPQEKANDNNFELSEDVSQWRENIQKTWNRFLDTFVVVHSRMGDLEPILPADQRENLKENLSLKLQIAQWAASKGKEALFVKSLNDVQAWLLQYFDMEETKNTSFNETIDGLKDKTITVDTSNKLLSLQAIRDILADREKIEPVPVQLPELTDTVVEEITEDVQNVTDTPSEVDNVIDEAAQTIETAEDTVEEALESDVPASVTEKTEAVLEKAEDKVKSAADEIKDTIESVTNDTEQAIEDKTNEIKEGV